ncbi:MAG: M13 family peptidase, partial [Burkholderiales bacterium]|nr:M13 family peptidase [Burkholderiales bacterium]
MLTVVIACGPARALESGVDAGIAPGDDFFAHANGDWLKATDIPAGKGRWGAFNEIGETTKRQVAAVLRDAGARAKGSSARKLADFHAAYVDETAIEAKSLTPIAPQLRRIAGLRDKAALARWLGSRLRADVDPLNLGVYASSSNLFGLAVQYGIHGEQQHFAY